MNIFVSSIIRDIFQVESVSYWVDSLNEPNIGVELLAFTHNDSYWKKLCGVLKKLRCPVSFHGPYIGIEGTSAPGTEDERRLMESYRQVFLLAREYGVRHVVYHTTQFRFSPGELEKMRALAERNVSAILSMAEESGVNVLIENLPYPPSFRKNSGPVDKAPLYTNEEYGSFFTKYPEVNSIIDIGHANINGMDLSEFLQQHGERVKAYHFHNNDGVHDLHNDMYNGTFSYSDFAPLYRRYTPRSDVVLEYDPHVELDDKALLSHIDYVLSNFAS